MNTTSTGREYIFNYMGTNNSVTLDGLNVLCKMGPFRKKNFPFASIVNYYVFEDKSYRALYITYTDETGKLKKVTMYSHLGEIGLRDLVEELNSKIQTKGLNHLPEKEAFKAMNAANPKKWAPIVAFLIIFSIITVFFIPALAHYFDYGFADAEVQQLISGEDLGTRNLNLSGIPLSENLEETTTTTKNGSTTTTRKVYIPLVAPDWESDQPVEVILQFDELSDSEFDAILESSEFVGVVRNIWYEGLEDDQIQFFVDNYDMQISENVVMFEVTGYEHNDDLMFWVWVGINIFMAIIFLIVYIKSRK